MNHSFPNQITILAVLILFVHFNNACQVAPPIPHSKVQLAPSNNPASPVYRTIRTYAQAHHYNTSTAFYVNLKIPSGKPRFFVLNLKQEQVITSALVTHGSGSHVAADSLIFSNKPGSNASSLGWYRIGSSYQGRFGLAYKLHGLSTSNSRAFERAVVLHAHPCVPDTPVFPSAICESWGCPTVSPAFLKKLQQMIQPDQPPVLLQIVYQ